MVQAAQDIYKIVTYIQTVLAHFACGEQIMDFKCNWATTTSLVAVRLIMFWICYMFEKSLY